VSFELPPNVTLAAFDRALAAFDRVVGKEWVLATDEDRGTYEDIYALQGDESHEPAAAVAPVSTEEVQAIVRLANEHKIARTTSARRAAPIIHCISEPTA
jgi:4-cresol dehydrogenase (hydroxylating) flavoprotein subunit